MRENPCGGDYCAAHEFMVGIQKELQESNKLLHENYHSLKENLIVLTKNQEVINKAVEKLAEAQLRQQEEINKNTKFTYKVGAIFGVITFLGTSTILPTLMWAFDKL